MVCVCCNSAEAVSIVGDERARLREVEVAASSPLPPVVKGEVWRCESTVRALGGHCPVGSCRASAPHEATVSYYGGGLACPALSL